MPRYNWNIVETYVKHRTPANNWDDAFADRLLVPEDIIYSSSNQSFGTDMVY